MNGICINRVVLFLMEIPGRKGLAFAFETDNKIIPVAYVPQRYQEEAKELWGKMLEGVPERA